jgi:hypothetical protein
MHGIESMHLVALLIKNLQNTDLPDSLNPPLEVHPRQPKQHQPQLPVLLPQLPQLLQPLLLKFLRPLRQPLPELLPPPARHQPSMTHQL